MNQRQGWSSWLSYSHFYIHVTLWIQIIEPLMLFSWGGKMSASEFSLYRLKSSLTFFLSQLSISYGCKRIITC